MRIGNNYYLIVNDIVDNADSEGPDHSPPYDWLPFPIVNFRPTVRVIDDVMNSSFGVLNESDCDVSGQSI